MFLLVQEMPEPRRATRREGYLIPAGRVSDSGGIAQGLFWCYTGGMTIIAEIGTAHGGSLEKAFSLIDAARDAGADAVKFQWVYADEILHPDTGYVKLPGGSIRLYDRFRSLEEGPAFFAETLDYAHRQGMLFICSPFGLRSLRELAALRPDALKIASPEVNHFPLLQEAARYYGDIPIILSSGVSKLGDIERACEILEGSSGTAAPAISVAGGKKLAPLTLLHCVTFYPAPEEEYNVRCVDTLGRVFGIPAGISDHSLDPVLIPVLSVAMGGTMIEKHITLSRQTDGLDDPVALEGAQFAQMVHAVHQAEAVLRRYGREQAAGAPCTVMQGSGSSFLCTPAQAEIFRQMGAEYGTEKVTAALGNGIKRLAPIERQNYGRTNRSLHYLRAMRRGEQAAASDIAVLRTEKVLSPGISPEFAGVLEGAVLQRDVAAGAGVQLEDFLQRPQTGGKS